MLMMSPGSNGCRVLLCHAAVGVAGSRLRAFVQVKVCSGSGIQNRPKMNGTRRTGVGNSPGDSNPSANGVQSPLPANKQNLAVSSALAFLLLLCFLTSPGCGQSQGDVIDPLKHVERNISQIERLFPTADAETKTARDRLAGALRAKDYEGVVAGIKTLGSTPGLTFDQSRYLNRLLLGVERRVVQEMAHGNTN